MVRRPAARVMVESLVITVCIPSDVLGWEGRTVSGRGRSRAADRPDGPGGRRVPVGRNGLVAPGWRIRTAWPVAAGVEA